MPLLANKGICLYLATMGPLFTIKYAYFWFEALALVACIACLPKFNSMRYRAFLLYLAVIVAYELASIFNWGFTNGNNLFDVCIEVSFEFVFFSYFIISGNTNIRQRRIFTLTSALILIFTVIDIYWIQGINKLCTYAILLQYVWLIVLVCQFFFRKMQQFQSDVSLARQPDFWAHTGLLFYFLCQFLFFAAFTTMAYKKIHHFSLLSNVILGVSIVILYSCLAVSFLCFRRTTKLLS